MKYLKLASCFGVISALGISMISRELLGDFIGDGQSLLIPSIAMMVQTFLMVTVLGYIGLRMMKSVNLSFSKVDTKELAVINTIFWGILVGFFIQGLDAFYYKNRIIELSILDQDFSLRQLIAGVLYGGVGEEVLLRLFLMTLIVWIYKITFKPLTIPNYIYIGSIFITSLLFALGHLPANAIYFDGLSFEVIERALLLNAVGGLIFGWLYWKYGLWYSMLAHIMTHVSMQLLFIPLLF